MFSNFGGIRLKGYEVDKHVKKKGGIYQADGTACPWWEGARLIQGVEKASIVRACVRATQE